VGVSGRSPARSRRHPGRRAGTAEPAGHRPGSATRHVITTLAVQVGDAATATADSYWLFWRDTATSPVLHNMGHYHDVLRREDGAWRIARRVITLG
jgi:3-phenylpropionate/cinnamic acid dioxygenase small subunit